MDPNKTLTEICEALFQTTSPHGYYEVLERIEALAKWIDDGGFKPDGWEGDTCTWDSLLVGAYWYCVENYDGMWSDEYRVQCIIGTFYRPGLAEHGCETDSMEQDVYDGLVSLRSYLLRWHE